MKIICFFLSLVLPVTVLTGQATLPSNRVVDVKILGTDSLVKGIYRSFKEFQDNNPSIRSDFLSVYSKNEVKEVCGDMSVTCLHILDRDGTLKPFTRYHWGLCDGRHVFICHYGRYYELSLDGKY